MHERLMRAMRAHDAEAAGRIWAAHLNNTGVAVAAALDAGASTET